MQAVLVLALYFLLEQLELPALLVRVVEARAVMVLATGILILVLAAAAAEVIFPPTRERAEMALFSALVAVEEERPGTVRVQVRAERVLVDLWWL
jgi:hypothetical protein